MSLYNDRNFHDLWISVNGSDILTMAFRTWRSRDVCSRRYI